MTGITMVNNIIAGDSDPTLDSYQIAVFYALSSYADNNTRACYPSYDTIATRAGCSRPTAIKAVKKLVEKGYIVKIPKKKTGRNSHACNLYIVPLADRNTQTPDTPTENHIEHEIAASVDESHSSSNENIDTPVETDIIIANADSLPSVREAFPQAKELLDTIEEYNTKLKDSKAQTLPSKSVTLPSKREIPKLDLLNYTALNYNHSDRSPYGDRDEILQKLDEYFSFEFFSDDPVMESRYRVITGYIAEMLTDEYTRIAKQKIHREEIARMIFATHRSTLHMFLDEIGELDQHFKNTRITKPNAYFKTVLIEYLRTESIIIDSGNFGNGNYHFDKQKHVSLK